MMRHERADPGRIELRHLLPVLGVDMQLAIGGGRGGYVGGHVQRHGENEAEVVVRVLAQLR